MGHVRQAEQEDFADYLATQWAPWQSVLNRLAQKDYETACNALVEAMGEPFTDRLQDRLRPAGLENDADAQRAAGPQVRAEIEREIMGQLTQNFLARNNLQIPPPGP